MKQNRYLEEGLGDIAVIRSTFETVSLFAPNDPIRAEMETIVSEAQANLVRRLQALCHQIREDPTAVSLNYKKFYVYALDMMIRGRSRCDLNRVMKVSAFDEGENALYYFEVAGIADLDMALQMPATEFAAVLYNEVLRAAQNQDHYTDLTRFDREVFQKYIALMFLHYSALDPMV